MKLRHGLPPIIPRIAKLPLNDGGYPVPFFVGYVDGKPDFRVTSPDKIRACIVEKLCWICGEPLGRFKAFVAGPMCGINRNSAEPPSHKDCAEWAVQACPFLVKPQMVRREDDFTRSNEKNTAGIPLKRNPGAAMVWVCEDYKLVQDGRGGVLFSIGEPVAVSWWAEGKSATRAQVEESIRTGLPLLEELCEGRPEDLAMLRKMQADFQPWLPNN